MDLAKKVGRVERGFNYFSKENWWERQHATAHFAAIHTSRKNAQKLPKKGVKFEKTPFLLFYAYTFFAQVTFIIQQHLN